MTDEPRTPADGDGRFLAELLGGISRRARALEANLRALETLDGERAAQRTAELESERERLGWGLVVAAGLLGADGAPARRERDGAAWLADLVELPGRATPTAWPAPRRESADWALAHALVRWAFEAALVGGGEPTFEHFTAAGASGDAVWSLRGATEAPAAELIEFIERELPGTRATAEGATWSLHLPADRFEGPAERSEGPPP